MKFRTRPETHGMEKRSRYKNICTEIVVLLITYCVHEELAFLLLSSKNMLCSSIPPMVVGRKTEKCWSKGTNFQLEGKFQGFNIHHGDSH